MNPVYSFTWHASVSLVQTDGPLCSHSQITWQGADDLATIPSSRAAVAGQWNVPTADNIAEDAPVCVCVKASLVSKQSFGLVLIESKSRTRSPDMKHCNE